MDILHRLKIEARREPHEPIWREACAEIETLRKQTTSEQTPMSETNNLVLEHLRAIRADIADIKREVTANSVQLSAMGQQLAGLTAAVYGSKADIDDIKRRLDRVEHRLELTDVH